MATAAPRSKGRSAGTNGQPLPVSPDHLSDLRKSGLSDETIRRCGFRSTSNADEIRQLLRWNSYNGSLGSCLVIPYFQADGAVSGHVRLKPSRPRKHKEDGKLIKYEAPKGLPNRAYLPPGDTLDALADPAQPLLITEGEKKAAKAEQDGFPCIGLSGVYAWQKKRECKTDERVLIPDLAAVAWDGRLVFIVFDSDATTNENVRLAEYHLAEALQTKGAVVSVVRLLTGADGAKVGLDDYLVAHGPNSLQALLDGAVEAQPAAIAPPWPEPLAAEAYHGLAGDIVRAIEPHSEADPVALLVQVLIAFGSALGRTAHFRAEEDYHYLNEFANLIGRTAKGRKGTSWGQVRTLVEQVDNDWAQDRIQSGLSSGEGLIWAVRDAIVARQPVKLKGRVVGQQEVETDPGVGDKRLLAYEPEFAIVLKQVERQGNTLSAILRQAWETGSLRTLTKNSPARASGAHVSLIGHITVEELRRYLSATESANGFGNRFLWLCVQRSKQLPEGGRPDRMVLDHLRQRLAEALTFGRTVGQMRRDDGARAVWNQVYGALSEGRPGLAGAMLARAEAHVMRLSCLYAVLDQSHHVRREHLLAALALWDYVEASICYIFGDSTGDPLADEVLRMLRAAEKQGLTRTEIMDALGRHKSSDQIGRALGLLLEHKLAWFIRIDTAGRPAERWFAGRG